MKKEIRLLWDVTKCGIYFKKDSVFVVKLLKTEMGGYIQRYPQDNTMESHFCYLALVEFDNGCMMSFQIDYEIHIVQNAE